MQTNRRVKITFRRNGREVTRYYYELKQAIEFVSAYYRATGVVLGIEEVGSNKKKGESCVK